jgi:mRNA interferase MazF
MKTYDEQLKLMALFDKVEREMGIEPSSYQTMRVERMVTNDMNANRTNSERRVCRGEIYYVVPEGESASDSSTFVGGRPAVIISNDMNNEMQGLVEVAYLTTHPRNNLPTNVIIMATGIKSTVICDQIYTVSKKRIGKYVNQCTMSEMKKINDALALGLALNFNEKSVGVNILESWKDELAKSYTTTQLNQISEADDALLQAKSEEMKSDVSEHVETPGLFILDILEEHFGDNAGIVMDSAAEFKAWLERCSYNNQKVDALARELDDIKSKPATVIADVSTSPDYIKVCAERDVYKELYMNAIAK